MATVIKLKTGTGTPTTSDLTTREVAIDTSAQKFYINDSGTIKEIGGASSSTLTALSDVSISSAQSSQHLYYNGTSWVNDYDYNIGKRVPFTKTDGTATTLGLVNNKDMTTLNGFLDHTVSQSYYLPFTNAAGTAITSIRPGHMPTLEGI
tara:strand:+ start:1258 stop:1707 length:450 start_codon:yes stop_codon:yes gene_type:complete